MYWVLQRCSGYDNCLYFVVALLWLQTSRSLKETVGHEPINLVLNLHIDAAFLPPQRKFTTLFSHCFIRDETHWALRYTLRSRTTLNERRLRNPLTDPFFFLLHFITRSHIHSTFPGIMDCDDRALHLCQVLETMSTALSSAREALSSLDNQCVFFCPFSRNPFYVNG